MSESTPLELIKRIKAVADTGLVYAQDPYDQERYGELRSISLQLMSVTAGQSLSTLTEFFMLVEDYPTPKVDIRGVVLNASQEILLVKEKTDDRWSLPGGWGEVGLSPSEVIEKEILEETSLKARAVKLLAVYDKRCHPHPPQPFYVYKLCFLCEVAEGAINPGFDIEEVGYFNHEQLPILSEDRILATQIEQLYRQATQKHQPTHFD